MKLTDFCIKHNKLPFVASLVILVAGVFAYFHLPMSTYPEIGIPRISVSTNYPGASAEVVDRTVNAIVEQQILSIEGVVYTESSSNNRGASSISAVFKPGFSELEALVRVQSSVSQVEPRLPAAVRQQGLTVSKGVGSLLLTINIISEDKQKDRIFLSNYASKNLTDKLSSVPGVSSVVIFGEMKHSLRLWLDPTKMYKYGLSVEDITDSVKEQSDIASVGRLGQPPVSQESEVELIVVSSSIPLTIEDFEKIILKSDNTGGTVYLGDVASVEIGSESYDETAKIDGQPTVMIGIFQDDSGNAVKISREVRTRMEEAAIGFPAGVDYVIKYDTSLYVEQATHEVLKTLGLAFLIVTLVVYVCLRTFDATLVPGLVVPISLFGTIFFLYTLSIGINLILLLGLILATGIVVDDAILVVERVNFLSRRNNLPPQELTMRAMRDMSTPIITTSLVLMIAFTPLLFYPGVRGILYEQFAFAIIVPVFISSVLALTLSPAMCSRPGFKSINRPESGKRPSSALAFGRRLYVKSIVYCIRHWKLSAVLLIATVSIAVYLARDLPNSFVPAEDPGYLVIAAVLPENTSLNKTTDLVDRIVDITNADNAVDSTIVVNGYNFIGGNSSNNGLAFAVLRDWDERDSRSLSLNETVERIRVTLNQKLGSEAVIYVFAPPTIPGLGSVGGFEFKLYRTGQQDMPALKRDSESFVEMIKALPEVEGVNMAFRADTPRYELRVDRRKAMTLGVDIEKFNRTIRTMWGSSYVTDFNAPEGSYRVIAQAMDSFRKDGNSLRYIHVPNNKGELIPVASFAELEIDVGPNSINRFNARQAISVTGSASFGYSTSEAIEAIEAQKSKAPVGTAFSWSGESAIAGPESTSGAVLFLTACLGVYLLLVVLYNSWLVPVAIILGIPISALGSLLAIKLFSLDLDIYSTVGLILAVALYVKAMVLVVDRAGKRIEDGRNLVSAVLYSMLERNRAVLMTSLSFIAGVIPLILTDGPGEAARFSLGISVIGGVIATIVAVLVLFPIILLKVYQISRRPTARADTYQVARFEHNKRGLRNEN